MPAFTLPPLKEPENIEAPVVASPQSISAWERRIQIPVNTEILEAVRVDDAAEIVLRGTIKELRSASQATGVDTVNSNFLTIEITDVACHTDDEARFLDDVHRGYGSKR
mgnify:CR=1 FL=1